MAPVGNASCVRLIGIEVSVIVASVSNITLATDIAFSIASRQLGYYGVSGRHSRDLRVSTAVTRTRMHTEHRQHSREEPRHAAVDANKVKIDVSGSTVTLSGEGHSWHEKDDAENAAWTASGVKVVHNNLCVVIL